MNWSGSVTQGGPVAVMIAALAGGIGEAPAAEECGPPEPGVEVVCTPDNYDAGEDGNVYYAEQVPDGDFSLRLDEGLAVTYHRDNPDDILVSDLVPGGHEHFSAVVAVPLVPAHAGDITLVSAADVTVTGFNVRGYLAGRIAGTGGVGLDLRGGSISMEGDVSRGVAGFHLGRGDIAAALRGTTVRGQGSFTNGVYLRHTGTGHILLDTEAAMIDVTGDDALGIFIDHIGIGDSLATLRGSAVSVSGDAAKGLFGYLAGEGSVALSDATVTVSGDSSFGVHLVQVGHGDLTVDAENATIDVKGAQSRGILSEQSGTGDVLTTLRDATVITHGLASRSLGAHHYSSGAVRVDAERTGFRAEGARARAINVFQAGEGDIEIDLRDGSTVAAVGGAEFGIAAFQADTGDIRIRAEGGSISAEGDSFASAVYAQFFSDAEGDVVVDLSEVAVTADGKGSGGVYIIHWGTRGDLSVRLRDTRIAAAGAESGGVQVSLYSGNGSIGIDIDGGSIVAVGDGANGVGVGGLQPETGAVTFAADVAADGYRDQMVKVNGGVRGGSGDGAGIRLAGGGRVEIGANGRVGADSGVAVRAVGDGAALHVSAEFDGRRPGDVFDGDIRNDAGRTTIIVDGVTLHDPMLGSTGALIPRGARDLTLTADDTVLGRTFSAADFVEPLAPRAAAYETLPDFLFQLAAPAGRRHAAPAPGGRADVEFGEGSVEAAGTTTGAAYDFERSAAVLALSGSLGSRFGAWIELHHGEADADVASPAGAGALDAVLRGYRAGASWQGSNWYAGASLASEDYLLDIATARRGALGAGIDARGRSLGVEFGRTVVTRVGTAVTPRAWLTRAQVSVDSFTDAVEAAVAVPNAERTVGGIGVEARFTREWNGGRALTLGGFADVESMSGDTETVVLVSGEPLTFETSSGGLSAGVSANYRRGRLIFGAALFTRTASDTGSAEHGARLNVGGLF